MEHLQLSHTELKTNISRLQEKVIDDLALVAANKYKGLKRKRNDSATAIPLPENVMEDNVNVKLEPEMQVVVKQEPEDTAPPPAEDDWADIHMGKQELIRQGSKLS